MNGHENEHDPADIEQRLSAMRPAEPAPSVKQRIAQSLDQDAADELQTTPAAPTSTAPVPAAPRPRPWVFGLAAAALIAVAGLVAVLAWPGPDTPRIADPSDQPPTQAQPAPDDSDPPPDPHQTQQTIAPATEPPAPTLLALNNAWRNAPGSIDKVLDRFDQTQKTHQAQPTPTPQPVLIAADARRWEELEF